MISPSVVNLVESYILREKKKEVIRVKEIVENIKLLPMEEAKQLLSIYIYVTDGDYGYGSWERGYSYYCEDYF